MWECECIVDFVVQCEFIVPMVSIFIVHVNPNVNCFNGKLMITTWNDGNNATAEKQINIEKEREKYTKITSKSYFCGCTQLSYNKLQNNKAIQQHTKMYLVRNFFLSRSLVLSFTRSLEKFICYSLFIVTHSNVKMTQEFVERICLALYRFFSSFCCPVFVRSLQLLFI